MPSKEHSDIGHDNTRENCVDYEQGHSGSVLLRKSVSRNSNSHQHDQSTLPKPQTEQSYGAITSMGLNHRERTNLLEGISNDYDSESMSSSSSSIEASHVRELPWSFRGPALFVAVILSFGSHWAGAAVNPLKSTLKTELGISNLQFGMLQGATSFVNTIVPLFGGLFIDKVGSAYSSVILSSIVTLGTTFVALSATFESFPIIVFGRALFGLANASLETVQSKIIAEWFVDKQLALVMGLYLSIARLGTFTGQITTIPIGKASGWWGWGLWVPVFFCFFCTLMSIAYLVMMMRLKQMEEGKSKRQRGGTSNVPPRPLTGFKWSVIFQLPGIFWLLCCAEYVQAGLLTSFLGTATELIQSKFGQPASVAAYNASVGQILPICIFPIIGFLIDRYGHRISINIVSSVTLLLCMSLLGFSMITPIIPLLLFSVGLSLGPVSMLTSIPLLIPPMEGMGLTAVGTATGVWKCFNNAGSTVFDIIVGLIQDNTPMETVPNGVYEYVLYFFVSMAGLSIILGLGLLIVDKMNGWRSVLQHPGRETRMENLIILHERRKMEGHVKEKSLFYRRIVPMIVFGISLLSSWILFFTISIRGPSV